MTTAQIPIPDLRFESSFFNSLQSKANSQHKAKLSKRNIQQEDIQEQQEQQDIQGPIPITPNVIIQVILKDVIIMPLLQGIIWSGILIVAKPWLSYAARNGRDYGVKLFKTLGFQTRKLRRA